MTTPAILDANVTTAKIADANITFAKLTDVIDDDTMATATDTTLATSESIKAYVDGTSNFTTEDSQSAGESSVSKWIKDGLGLPLALRQNCSNYYFPDAFPNGYYRCSNYCNK